MRNSFQVLSNTLGEPSYKIFLLISFRSIIEWHPQPPRHSRELRRQFTTSLGTVKPSFKVIWDSCHSEHFQTDWPSDWLQMQLDDRSRQEIVARCEVWAVRSSPLLSWQNINNNHQQPTGSSRKVSLTDLGPSSVKGKCPKWDNLFPIRPVLFQALPMVIGYFFCWFLLRYQKLSCFKMTFNYRQDCSAEIK